MCPSEVIDLVAGRLVVQVVGRAVRRSLRIAAAVAVDLGIGAAAVLHIAVDFGLAAAEVGRGKTRCSRGCCLEGLGRCGNLGWTSWRARLIVILVVSVKYAALLNSGDLEFSSSFASGIYVVTFKTWIACLLMWRPESNEEHARCRTTSAAAGECGSRLGLGLDLFTSRATLDVQSRYSLFR